MSRVYIAGQIYPPTSLYGSNGGHQIANFVFLHYISFINAFTALECINKYWENIHVQSLYRWWDFPPNPPLWVKVGS